MKKRILLAACVFSIGVFSPRTLAGVVSTSGNITAAAMPGSLINNAMTSNSALFLLTESQGVTLSSDIGVDIQQSGSYSWFSRRALASVSGTISAGTSVNSYLLHFDPARGIRRVSGIVTFAEPIVGLMVRGASLNATDAILGAPGTSYESGTFRGSDSIFDKLTLSSDSMSLSVDRMLSFGSMDQVRIVTASAVPEPPTVALALLGLVAIGWSNRDRKNGHDAQ